jgi:hypothetical protein
MVMAALVAMRVMPAMVAGAVTASNRPIPTVLMAAPALARVAKGEGVSEVRLVLEVPVAQLAPRVPLAWKVLVVMAPAAAMAGTPIHQALMVAPAAMVVTPCWWCYRQGWEWR